MLTRLGANFWRGNTVATFDVEVKFKKVTNVTLKTIRRGKYILIHQLPFPCDTNCFGLVFGKN